MNQEKKRLNKFLQIIDKHILREMSQEKGIDTRLIGVLFNIRTEIITRLGEITSTEKRKRMWKEFRDSDYHGDNH